MTAAIIPSGDQGSGELSEARKKQLYDEAQRIYSHGIQFGWRAEIYKSAALHNIKELGLHWSDGLTWAQCLESLGIETRSAQRYLRIGKRMAEMCGDVSAMAEGLPFFFTQRNLHTTFEPFFTNGHKLTLTSLYDASKSLDTFKGYLNGEKVSEADAVKLLQEANTFSEKEQEKRGKANFLEEDATSSFHAEMERLAADKGFVWNRKKSCFLTKDGEPLSEKELAELETPEKAMRLWRSMRTETASLIKRTRDLFVREGSSYLLYAKHINSTRFRQDVQEERQRIHDKFKILDAMTDALLEGDLDKAEMLFKKGVEE